MPRHRTPSKLELARARMYRELVFECAEHVFAERGYDASTMQDIAAAAGISLKTLYATFPGKGEIYREVLGVRSRELFESVAKRALDGPSPAEKLAQGVRAYVAFLLAHRDFLRIHLRARLAWGLGPGSEEEAAAWREGVAMFSQVVREGIEDGSFHPGDPELLARMGMALMQVQLSSVEGRPADADPEELCEEVLLPIRRMLCRSAD